MNSMLAQTGGLFYPERASTLAWQTDRLYLTLVGVLTFFTILIFTMILRFMIRYRRRRADEWPPPIHGNLKLELTWTFIPLVIGMGLFAWGADLYFAAAQTPPGASDIYVVGRQWMWKIQHPSGRREINELHVPLGQPIRLTLTSEDVIHSFFVPAFRMKRDTVPGRYTEAWFEATQLGEYHLFCAEYCGTSHSGMIGWVDVMEPAEYQAWLGGGATSGSLAANGEQLFQQQACATCHRSDNTGRGPKLEGLFGSKVQLDNGQAVVADESYLRESILNPQAKIAAGYPRPSDMPTFDTLINEEQLLQLIAYIKSIGPQSKEGAKQPPGKADGQAKQKGLRQ